MLIHKLPANHQLRVIEKGHPDFLNVIIFWDN